MNKNNILNLVKKSPFLKVVITSSIGNLVIWYIFYLFFEMYFNDFLYLFIITIPISRIVYGCITYNKKRSFFEFWIGFVILSLIATYGTLSFYHTKSSNYSIVDSIDK